MMMLKNSLSGKPLQAVERLGYTPKQYQAGLDKLEQKYGGKKTFTASHGVYLTCVACQGSQFEGVRDFLGSFIITDVVAKLKIMINIRN